MGGVMGAGENSFSECPAGGFVGRANPEVLDPPLAVSSRLPQPVREVFLVSTGRAALCRIGQVGIAKALHPPAAYSRLVSNAATRYGIALGSLLAALCWLCALAYAFETATR